MLCFAPIDRVTSAVSVNLSFFLSRLIKTEIFIMMFPLQSETTMGTYPYYRPRRTANSKPSMHNASCTATADVRNSL
jgi:hypothetical protein